MFVKISAVVLPFHSFLLAYTTIYNAVSAKISIEKWTRAFFGNYNQFHPKIKNDPILLDNYKKWIII